jgi:hypothetical protein
MHFNFEDSLWDSLGSQVGTYLPTPIIVPPNGRLQNPKKIRPCGKKGRTKGPKPI